MVTKWGIMGAAGIAQKMFLPAAAKVDNAEVTAIASRSKAKGQTLADAFGVSKVMDSYGALLADPEIDAIYIPLPNADHVTATLDALRAGKHVLCEKPIAMQADEIAQILTASQKAARHAVEGFMVAYHPQWQQVRDWIAQGEIGEVQQVHGTFSYHLDDRANIRNRADGGALRDIGVYPVFVTRLITGQEPRRVFAKMRSDASADSDIHTTAMMEFEGFDASFYVSSRADRSQGLVVYGTHGRIEVPNAYNPPDTGDHQVFLFKGNALDRSATFSDVFQFARQISHLSDVFQGTGEPLVTLDNSAGNQRAVDAIRASGKSAQWRDVVQNR